MRGFAKLLGAQVGDDVSDLGIVKHGAEGGHGAAPELDHVLYAFVIGGCAAGEELLAENAFQRRPLRGRAGVRLVTLLAIGDEELLAAKFVGTEWTPETRTLLLASGG